MGGENYAQDSISSPQSSSEMPSPDDVEQLRPYQQKVQRRYKKVELDSARVKYWLGVGAQPTDSVGRFFNMVSAYFVASSEWSIAGVCAGVVAGRRTSKRGHV